MSEQKQDVAATEEQQPVLQIQRIYVKDVSFEAPNLPHIFQQEWKPKLGFDLSTETTQVGDDLYEVVLNISVETCGIKRRSQVRCRRLAFSSGRKSWTLPSLVR